MPPAKPQATAVAVGKKIARPRHRGSAGVGRQLSGPAGRLAHAGDDSPSAAPATPSGDGVIASPSGGGNAPLDVPVVSWSGRLLMPWHPARARELVRRGRAVCRFSAGVFYIQLPPVACEIDPGSTREAYTVKSAAPTYLSIGADAVAYVRDAVATRRQRCRSRATPCGAPRGLGAPDISPQVRGDRSGSTAWTAGRSRRFGRRDGPRDTCRPPPLACLAPPPAPASARTDSRRSSAAVRGPRSLGLKRGSRVAPGSG